jgi:RNA polymerase sigma factor (TIGR02999 family)
MSEAFVALYDRARRGDRAAGNAIYEFAFYRLKGIASTLLSRERAGHTLQPTALVSELFFKLGRLETRILSEDHFFRISARAMRQVLIDHARTKKPANKVPLEVAAELALIARQSSVVLESSIAVRTEFEKLRRLDNEVAETVWLRCVEGLTIDELSAAQRREPWRVRADYDFGLQWLANRINRQR